MKSGELTNTRTFLADIKNNAVDSPGLLQDLTLTGVYTIGGIGVYGPDPEDKAPMKGFPQVGYLKNFISRDNIIVGDYTYYDDPEDQSDSRIMSCIIFHSSATS